MKKLNSIIAATVLLVHTGMAQVAKKVVVEHFTNSVCSICASRNPGFYTNLSGQDDILHLAIHPSSPYSSCILNKHNKTENDGRTNYYGIYGSTPRLVIQGTVISNSANYSSASIFTPFLSQTTPASIHINQYKYGNDSIKAMVVLKTMAPHSLGNLKLFVALAEDTLFYSSPNGEKKHYDVFRKSLTGFSGKTVTLPAAVGDSVVFTMSSPSDVAWDFSRIYTIAILQEESSKAVVQSDAVPAKKNDLPTGIANEFSSIEVAVYPNPVQDNLIVRLPVQQESTAYLYDIHGKLVSSVSFDKQTTFSMSLLASGQYLLVVENKKGRYTGKITKQ